MKSAPSRHFVWNKRRLKPRAQPTVRAPTCCLRGHLGGKMGVRYVLSKARRSDSRTRGTFAAVALRFSTQHKPVRAPERGTHRLARSPLKFEFSGAVTGSARGALTPCVSRTVHPLITCSSLACSVLIMRMSTRAGGSAESASSKRAVSTGSVRAQHSNRTRSGHMTPHI